MKLVTSIRYDATLQNVNRKTDNASRNSEQHFFPIIKFARAFANFYANIFHKHVGFLQSQSNPKSVSKCSSHEEEKG